MMPRENLLPYFRRIRELKNEMDSYVPISNGSSTTFRAELAGLLVVYISANYENCVKESINSYADRCHVKFGEYASRNYAKINSRINCKDLKAYANNFDPEIEDKFTKLIGSYSVRYPPDRGFGIKSKYEAILGWRHAYAHSGERITTIEEVFEFHNIGKHVLYCFEVALNGP